jgi:diketogulonate reductase-like aldo/keto reductase
MECLFQNGGVKQLGISNCYDLQQFELLYKNATIKPAVIQNRFYAKTGYDRDIRNFCRQHRIIYQSFWTLTGNPDVLAHATLQALAMKYQRSAAQVFFRYLNQINIIPLTGTTSATHMREDLEISDFELTSDECAAVELLL